MFEQESKAPNPRLLVSAKIRPKANSVVEVTRKSKIGMSTGAWKIVPFAGLVMRTIGEGWTFEPPRHTDMNGV